jgi:thiamine biosynthesis lipoprotein
MKIIIIVFIQFLILFTAIYKTMAGESLKSVNRLFFVMGTNLEFNLICKDRQYCLDAINDSLLEVKRIDKIFSNYRSDSELSNLAIKTNRKVEVSQEFFELTAFSVFMLALSKGAFDISVGPMVDLWKKESKKNAVPDKTLIDSTKNDCIGFDKLKLYSKENKIGFSSDCIKLDYGGVGKGYVIQRIVQLLQDKNIENVLINFGGNIYALGNDLRGKPWIVNIKDPEVNNRYIKRIRASNLSISTSGGYERYFLVDDKKYSHIIDPRTGFPVSHFSSVTVVSQSPLFADALSTALSVLSIDESRKIIKELDKIGVLIIEKSENKVKIYENDNFKNMTLN